MSQTIFPNIDPDVTSGNTLATLLNDFKDAVASGFSGTSRPTNLQAGGYWIDTTNNPTWDYKIYDGTDDTTVFSVNTTTGVASIASADTMFEIAKISADSVGAILRLHKERIASGGQTLADDTLGEIQFRGTRSTGVEVTQTRIRSLTTEDTTASNQGADLIFEATAAGTASLAEVMRIKNGNLAVGTQTATDKLHVLGDIKSQKSSDDAVGAFVKVAKKRASGLGQVQNNDVLGTLMFRSTDDAGTEFDSVAIEASARELQTSSAQASQLRIRTKRTGQTSFTTQVTIGENVTVDTNLTVTGNLTVNGTTTSVNSTTLDVADSNISVNKGGNQAAANTNKAGIKVEMSDATHAQIGYDSTKASKFVIGNVGSEAEIADVSSAQTLTNKTITGATINNPARAGVKEGTESSLTTYAASATNGQFAFATDTKVMYQVIDNALVPVGAGGGGTTLNWNKTGDSSPVTEDVDGFRFESFDNSSSQEIYAVLTVPSSYRAGKPIKLKYGQFFANVTSGNVFFKAATALIQSTTVLGTYPNIHNSTNTQVTVSGTANTVNSIGDIDLSSSTGQINGVAIAPGDKLRIRLFRDNAAESSPAAADARLMIENFEPTFS